MFYAADGDDSHAACERGFYTGSRVLERDTACRTCVNCFRRGEENVGRGFFRIAVVAVDDRVEVRVEPELVYRRTRRTCGRRDGGLDHVFVEPREKLRRAVYHVGARYLFYKGFECIVLDRYDRFALGGGERAPELAFAKRYDIRLARAFERRVFRLRQLRADGGECFPPCGIVEFFGIGYNSVEVEYAPVRLFSAVQILSLPLLTDASALDDYSHSAK